MAKKPPSKSLAKQGNKTPAKATDKKAAAVVSTEVVVASLEKQANPAINKLKKITVVNSQADFDLVAEQIKMLKVIDKQAEQEEKSMTDPLAVALKRIKAHFKPFHDKVDKLEIEGKKLMEGFLQRNALAIKKVEEDFSKGKIAKVSTYTEKTNALRVSNSGAGKVKQISKLFINDVNKIPREFLVPDETAITAHFKNGGTVSGCEYKKVNSISI